MENQKGKEISKTAIVHGCVIFLFLCLCGIFFMLGGGTNTNNVTKNEVNIDTLPDIMVEDVATSKVEAYKRAEALIAKEQQEKKLQNEHNSFDFFAKQLETPESTVQEKDDELENKLAENEKSVQELKGKTITKKNSNRGGVSRKKEGNEEEIDYDERIRAEKEKRRKEICKIFDEKEKQETENTNTSSTPSIQKSTAKSQDSNPFKPMNEKNTNSLKNGIRAVIHGEQKNVTTSSLVKIRTQEEFEINGTTIPKNTIIIGKAKINKNRVEIVIDNIVYNDNLYPFNGQIYDLDGSKGLYIADNSVNEGINNATSDAISNTDVTIQGGGSGIAGIINTGANAITMAAKKAASNKNKETKVTLSANYKLTIKLKE